MSLRADSEYVTGARAGLTLIGFEGSGHPSFVLEAPTAATDLDLISFLKAIPDTRMRRGIRIPA